MTITTLQNKQEKYLTRSIEPAAEEIQLLPGQTAVIENRYKATFAMEYPADSLVIYEEFESKWGIRNNAACFYRWHFSLSRPLKFDFHKQ